MTKNSVNSIVSVPFAYLNNPYINRSVCSANTQMKKIHVDAQIKLLNNPRYNIPVGLHIYRVGLYYIGIAVRDSLEFSEVARLYTSQWIGAQCEFTRAIIPCKLDINRRGPRCRGGIFPLFTDKNGENRSPRLRSQILDPPLLKGPSTDCLFAGADLLNIKLVMCFPAVI